MQKSKKKGQPVRLGRRVLALLLCVCMITTLVPISAHAETKETEQGQIRTYANETNVAQVTIGSTTTKYADLEAAFAAAQEAESATVMLLSDVTNTAYGEGISLEKGDITFDLNGYTLTGYANSDYPLDIVLWVTGSYESDGTPVTAALTLKDSKGSGKIVQPGYLPVIKVDEYGKLTVEGGTLENTTTVNKDTFETVKSSVVNCAILTSGETIIRGGTMSGRHGVVVNGGTLTVEDGTFTGAAGNALIVHDGTAQLSGGTYSNDTSQNDHSIWVMNDGKASSLLADGYRYETPDGKVSEYNDTGSGVKGNTTVKKCPEGEYSYIDADGKVAVRTGCKEITADTTELTDGWYAVKGKIDGSIVNNVNGEVNLILCDGAEWKLSGELRMGKAATLNIYAQSAGTGKLTTTGWGMKPAIGMDTGKSGGTLNIYGGVITATSQIDAPSASGEIGVSENRGAAIGTCGESSTDMSVNIYGGTVTAKATYGTKAIGNGQAANGTVNVTIADGMKCVQTDDPNTPAAYDNTDGTSVTITKCSDHKWKYTTSETNHTSKCKLCGAVGTTEAHDYKNWKADEDADTHTGTCVCGAEKTEDHTLTYRLSANKKSHYSECSICGYKSAEKLHDTNGTDGSCSVCGADKDIAVEKAEVTITALDGTVTTTKYADLIEAFDDADISRATKIEVKLLQSGKTYTLDSTEKFPIKFEYTHGVEVIVDLNGCTLKRSVADNTYGILKVVEGNVTIKNGTLDLDDSESSFNPAQAIKTPSGYSPTLTLENMTIKVVDIDTAVGYRTAKGYAIRAEGGALNIKSGTYGKVFINDTHATAKLSGGSYDSVMCYEDCAGLLETGYIFAKQDGTYIDPGTMRENSETGKWVNTENIKVIPCTHEGGYTNGKCNQCGTECGHTGVDESGQCSVCRMQMVAQDNSGKYFTTLAAAIEAAKDNGTVTLLTDVEENITITDGMTVTTNLNGKTWQGFGTTWTGCQPVPLTVSGGSVTVKNGTLKQGGASSNANTAVIVNGGSLTVGEKMNIQGGKYDSGTVLPAITVESGSLTLTENTNLYGGMKVTVAGKLLKDYLPEGTAFAVGDSIINGYVQSYVNGDTLTVVEHTHSYTDGACVCGATCLHDTFENGVCTVCGYKCPHEHVSETDGVTTCSDCKAQMVLKVTSGDTTTYYAQTFDRMNTENTLQTILNDDTITPDGSTITLLANDLWAFAFVYDGKTVTLNLNGKNLIETGNGIAVDENSKLIVTGEGTSTRTGNLDNREYSYVFNVRGGTLEFDESYFGGTFNGIRVGSGTLISPREGQDNIHIGTLQIDDTGAQVSFKAAAFDKIDFGGTSGSVKLGDLLGVWRDTEGNRVFYGNAFQTADGTFLRYDTEISTGSPLKNVRIVTCRHDSLGEKNTCEYCGTPYLAAILYDGTWDKMRSIMTYTGKSFNEADMQTSAGCAFNDLWGWRDTLKLFMDAELGDRVANCERDKAIDLNGHKVTDGTLTLEKNSRGKNTELTITDYSEGKNGEFPNVKVSDGTSLIVDGIHMGTITAADSTAKVTLKAGSSLEGYSLPAGMMLADWIEDGCCIYDTGADGNSRIPVELTETGAKTAAGKFVVEKAAAEITAGIKSGELPYGSGVPGEFCPKVTLEDTAAHENVGSIKVDWYRRTDNGCKPIGSGTIKDGSYGANFIIPDLKGVKIEDTLNVFCTITAVGNTDDKTSFWQTVLTGYELTVVKGNSSVITAPAATENMVYKATETDKTWPLVTAGKAEGGTMVYSLSKDGTYTETVPTAENAGNYTVWYKVLGDENHTDTEPESVTAQIAKAEITLTGLDIHPKSYDGTTKADIISANFQNSSKQAIGELACGKDYKVEAAFEDANVGDGKKVKATVTLCDTEKTGNYVLMNNEVEDISSITKADALDTAGGTLYIRNNCTDTYTFDLSQLLPELAEPKTFGKVTYDTLNLKWSGDAYSDEKITVDESGKVSIKVKSTSSVEEDAGTLTVNVVTSNYADMKLKLAVKSTNKKVVELQTGSKVSPNGTLIYGQKLSELAFQNAVFVENGTDTAVKGTLKWSTPDVVPEAGTGRACWVFTPEDTKRYIELTGWTSVTVEKADPVVSELPAVADRVYDPEKVLTDADLTGGTVSVDGSWSFSRTDIVPTVDNTGYEAVFTPTDTKNYNTITRTIAVKVTQATPTIVETPSASAITYGDALSESKLTGGKAAYKDTDGTEISGTFDWKEPAQKPSGADSGVTEYAIIFTPDDIINYRTVEAKITLAVKKAAAPETTEGTLYILSNQTMTYDYDLSELLPALEGSKSLGKVTYGTPTIAWNGTGYQEKNVKVEESGKMTLVISSKNAAEEDAGTITVTVKTENYEDITLTLVVKSVEKKAVEITKGSTVSVLHDGKLTYGQKLSDLTLGGATFVEKGTEKEIEGTLKWSNPDAVPDAGTTKADWVFVPKENDIYSEVTGSTAITVEKAAPYIAEKPLASEITEGESLDASKLTGGKATYSDAKGAEIAGSFAWKQGSIKPSVSDSGVTEYEVIFTPEDVKNYTTVTIKITISVKAASQTSETPAPEQTAKPGVISQTQQKKNGLALNSKWKVTQTGKKIKIRWGKVTGATGYRVYVQYSDAKFTKKSAIHVSGKKSALTITKINGKKINLKKNFKVYVEAYKMVNGKQVTIGKSLEAYAAGRKNSTYTNAKAIKLNKKSFTLKVGKSAKIKAKTVLKDKTKKALTKSQVKEFRYDTTDASVATVSSGGKITAKGKGTCKIYVYARNGYTKSITVTVK